MYECGPVYLADRRPSLSRLPRYPLADAARYLPASFVRPSEGELSVRQMVEEAIAAHDKAIAEMHKDADTAGKAGDIGTADLFTRLVQQHQKQRWFLKEILRKD